MKRFLAAAALAAGLAAPAHAGFVVTNIGMGDVEFTLPGNNDFAGVITPLGYDFYFHNVGLSVTDPVIIDFYVLASESGFTNRFNVTGPGGFSYTEAVDVNPANPFPGVLIGSTAYGAPGAITNWNFEVVGGPVPAGCNPDGTCQLDTQAFAIFAIDFATWNTLDLNTPGIPSSYNAGDTIILAFDDDGAGPDDNHDDLMIVAKIRAVIPEPATWSLMIGSFGLLGAATRRRRLVKA